jgi:hypothetical protein
MHCNALLEVIYMTTSMQNDMLNKCRAMNHVLNTMLASEVSDTRELKNEVSGHFLSIKGNKNIFTGIVDPKLSLNDRIRYINKNTAIKTSISSDAAQDTGSTSIRETDVPYGMGLFKLDKMHETILNMADDEIQKLFGDETNYADLSPYTRRSYDNSREFVALFWSSPEKICSTLQEVIYHLKKRDFAHLANILLNVYVLMIASILEIDRELVLQAPTEIIYYEENGYAGLEQHIDNVNRTGGVLGPVCSINFVGSRFFDMLPCLETDKKPFRVETERGDLLILDSMARILWSHAVPYNAQGGRYSVVIRPICDRFGDSPIISKHPVLRVPIFQTPPLLSQNRPPSEHNPPTSTPESVTPSTDTSADPTVPDSLIADFWADQGVQPVRFERGSATLSSVRDMMPALRRNRELRKLFASKLANPGQLSIWEAYGHDGADTLTFIHSFRNCSLCTMCHDTNRVVRLKANISTFKHAIRARTNVKTFQNTFSDICKTITSNVDLLYLDPKWKDDTAPNSTDELNVLALCRSLQDEIFTPCEEQLQFIQSICFKVRYDWPVFQCIMLMCKLQEAGFQHCQTMDIYNGPGKPPHAPKHHYFHVITKTSHTFERTVFPLGNNRRPPRSASARN